MWRVVLVLVASCGGDKKQVIEPEPPHVPDAAVDAAPLSFAADLTPEQACARFATLAQGGCFWTQRFPPEMAQPGACVPSLAGWVAPGTPERDKLQAMISCWSLECESAANCMVAQQSTTPRPPRTCGTEGTGRVIVDAKTWDARRGATTKRFADIKTSVAEPVEVCGIEGEVAWMTTVTCNDGSNPYGSAAKANESRDAWVEKGGRCNSVLDRYSVRCPEATYQIHVDRYICQQ